LLDTVQLFLVAQIFFMATIRETSELYFSDNFNLRLFVQRIPHNFVLLHEFRFLFFVGFTQITLTEQKTLKKEIS